MRSQPGKGSCIYRSAEEAPDTPLDRRRAVTGSFGAIRDALRCNATTAKAQKSVGGFLSIGEEKEGKVPDWGGSAWHWGTTIIPCYQHRLGGWMMTAPPIRLTTHTQVGSGGWLCAAVSRPRTVTSTTLCPGYSRFCLIPLPSAPQPDDSQRCSGESCMTPHGQSHTYPALVIFREG